jgi:hypothetical protein
LKVVLLHPIYAISHRPACERRTRVGLWFPLTAPCVAASVASIQRAFDSIRPWFQFKASSEKQPEIKRTPTETKATATATATAANVQCVTTKYASVCQFLLHWHSGSCTH